MTFYDELVQVTADSRNQLYTVPQLAMALKGDITVDVYRSYLIEAYHHVKHTVPFLMRMGSKLAEENRWLHKVIIEYLSEEEGHEEWILNDIEALGGDRSIVKAMSPHLETQALIAYNYDYIERKNPVGFLGMVFMLESTSCELATKGANIIKKSLGLNNNAFTYLLSHGSLDQSHMLFYKDTVNKIICKKDKEAIIEVASNTFILFANVMSSIPQDQGTCYAA